VAAQSSFVKHNIIKIESIPKVAPLSWFLNMVYGRWRHVICEIAYHLS